jgi:iron complex transport system ATP-binding protein
MSLTLSQLSIGYDPERAVIGGMTSKLEDGITVLLGPNGCGKTTLLRALAGALPVQCGSIRMDGCDLLAMPAAVRARRVSLIPQMPSVSAAFSVREVVELGRYAHPADAGAVRSALVQTDLLELSDSPFHELSAGQQQRVTLARALAQLAGTSPDKKLLLADEPFAAMDPARAMRCIRIMRELSERGVMILLVAHDFTTCARTADHAILLGAHGQVIAQGTSRDVIAPEPLQAAFGIPFERIETGSGPIVVVDQSQAD